MTPVIPATFLNGAARLRRRPTAGSALDRPLRPWALSAALVAVVGLVGCTDPVDAFLDARDAFYAEACECVPVIVAVTDSSQECYDKKRVTSAGRECVHIAVGQSEAMENAYKCRGGAVEAFTTCLARLATCDADGYFDCEDVYKMRSDGCPDVPDSIENGVDKCLD